MVIHLQSRASDLAIRAAGLSLLPVGGIAIRTLYRLIHAGPLHDTTAIELGLAALGFISFSLGSLLLALGAHIFDRVEVSPRWAPRHDPGQKVPVVSLDQWHTGGTAHLAEMDIFAPLAMEKIR